MGGNLLTPHIYRDNTEYTETQIPNCYQFVSHTERCQLEGFPANSGVFVGSPGGILEGLLLHHSAHP